MCSRAAAISALVLASILLQANCMFEQRIEVVGCVRPGVEAGCIVLVTEDGRSYTLFGAERPTSGWVRVQGTVPNDVGSFCMQGTIVRVETFEVLSQQCPTSAQ
jgi:hypothetical protein